MNSTIVGSIKLCLSDTLKGKFQDKGTTVELITALKAEYAALGISGTFALFKELLDAKIAQSFHPAPSLNKVAMLFACLEAMGYPFPTNIQAMLLLAKLPQSMGVVLQMIVHTKDSTGKPKAPTVEGICEAVVLSWDQRHMKDTPKAALANKISTVKHKRDDPKFKQQ